jgi:ABC-2 type transport system ATP-binding protein
MIEVEHLSKRYGPHPAIDDVCFTVEPGEILGFLGPNGAGKTTTMRILSGYLPATAGTARVAGYDVHSQSMAVRQRIGYLPETPPLYEDMTVRGYLFFVARLKGVSAGDRAAQVDLAMAQCNLETEQDTLICRLSKGFRQRVGLAQAIVHNPPVIILDEPTVGLDPRQIIEVRHLIKGLAGNHTIILSTHILPEVSMTCDRVAIINHGKIVATDTPDTLMEALVGSLGYAVEVSGATQLLTQKLNAIAGVRDVQLSPLPDSARMLLHINCQGHSEPGAAIASTIIKSGGQLHEMQRTRPTLEDVFLELTTEEEPIPPVEDPEPIPDEEPIPPTEPTPEAANPEPK